MKIKGANDLNSDFKDVLYLFACGAKGISPKITHKININEVYKISCQQGIWGVVFLSVKTLKEDNMLEIDDKLFSVWENQFFSAATIQLRKRDIINNVLEKLEYANIPAYLLKGDIVAQYYEEPLSRTSSDTDIYVGEKMLSSAEKIFEQSGFDVAARSPMEHHTVCNHRIGGSVDLHLTFHDDCFEEKYFKGYTSITEKGAKYKIDEYYFQSLGVNDNAIFLFLHLVKHFLSCGSGIRQVMDFLLFWENNKEKIDLIHFKKMLSDLGFEKLFASYIKIGVDYLCFDKNSFDGINCDADKIFTEWLLMDIESGGIFGKLEQRKLTFYYLFGDNYSGMNNEKWTEYVKKYINTFRYDFLSKKYRYINKSKILIPVAWLNRIYDLIISAIRVIFISRKSKKQNDEMSNIKSRLQIINTIYKK